MSPKLRYGNLGETRLFIRLNEGFRDTDHRAVADELSADVRRVCREAAQRMKLMQALHKQYTLHDEVHLLRVTALMSCVMPEEVLNGLNPVELALLILSAHLHDQGMIPDGEQLKRIEANEDPQLKDFERRWLIDNPKLIEVRRKLKDDTLSESNKESYRIVEQQLREAMITDFVRQDHGRRSAQYVRARYENSDLLIVEGASLAPFVAKLCESHEKIATWISEENGFRVDEAVGGYDVNMQYLALVLRLADILDFDRDRVPEPLYQNINFTSEISLKEWEKHRSIRDWKIDHQLIQFIAECEHPVYQKALYDFMDWIDRELESARSLVASYPEEVRSKYHFDNLPPAVDRKRIGPKEGPQGPLYDYHDVVFSLSRNEIVKLLMTNNLYRSPSLCVRELLQNSLDALRHRVALHRKDGETISPSGVWLEHKRDEHGQELLVCKDDGVGMNIRTVSTFLTQVGRSYYRSPEFEWERETFRTADPEADFDPCAQFGIGFMSCFMLGDEIKIRTRRDKGPSKGYGDALEIQINGLDSMLVIRRIPEDLRPGTEIEIKVRDSPLVYDMRTDRVELTQVVQEYAVACEFPIQARNTIPGIEDRIRLKPGVYEKRTEMERAGVERCETLEQLFTEVDRHLGGKIRVSFLVDDNEKFTVANGEARWERDDSRSTGPFLLLEHGDEKGGEWSQRRLEMLDGTYYTGHICLDGIVVAGALRTPTGWGKPVPGRHDPIRLGRTYFTLDVRGKIKPPLTPARTPEIEVVGERDLLGRATYHNSGWLRLRRLANRAAGMLWERVAQRCSDDPDTFWQLAIIHQVLPDSLMLWMRAGYIWSHLWVPLGNQDGGVEFRKVSDLGRLLPYRPREEDSEADLDVVPSFVTPEDLRVRAPESVERWTRREYYSVGGDEEDPEFRRERGWNDWTFLKPVIAASTLTLEGNVPLVDVREPLDYDVAPGEYALLDRMYADNTEPLVMTYSGVLRDVMAAPFARESLNRDHPFVRLALESQYQERITALERFAERLVEFVTEYGFHKMMDEEWPTDRDQLRYLGVLFRAVDWNSVPEQYHPPYKIWSPELGFDAITAEKLERWAEFAPGRIRRSGYDP